MLQADREFPLKVLRSRPVLNALRAEYLKREEIERRLDISSATSCWYINWLDQQCMMETADEVVSLTPLVEAIAAEGSTFENTIRRALRVVDGGIHSSHTILFQPIAS